MRVLFVTNQFPMEETPGSGPCVEQQRKALQRLGNDVDVLFVNGGETKLNYVKAMWRLFRVVQLKKQYDIVHAHYGYCGLVARAQICRPVVVTFRGSDVLCRRERLLSRLLARLVSGRIVMTEEMKKLLGHHDTHIIPYGIDLDLFQPRAQAEARQDLGLPLGIPLVLFPYDPGRTVKRFDLVEKAAAILRRDFPQLQVLAIYDKPHSAVVDYMNACDVLALTSDSEGSPVAVREAMACNLPVVSVRVGDVPELIRDTEGCYLCEREPSDIAAKLARVLRARNQTKGRQVVSRFSVLDAAVEVAALYGEFLGQAWARSARQDAVNRSHW